MQNAYHMVTMATPHSCQRQNLGDYLDTTTRRGTQFVPWDHMGASLVIWLCVWEPVWSSACLYGSQSGHLAVCMGVTLARLCLGASLVTRLCAWDQSDPRFALWERLVILLCVWELVWSSGCVYGSQSGCQAVYMGASLVLSLLYESQSGHLVVCMGVSLVTRLCVWEPGWSSGHGYGSQSVHLAVYMGVSLVTRLCVWEPGW